MSYSLNSLKVIIQADFIGDSYRGCQGGYCEFIDYMAQIHTLHQVCRPEAGGTEPFNFIAVWHFFVLQNHGLPSTLDRDRG